jgi:hypothetical protein
MQMIEDRIKEIAIEAAQKAAQDAINAAMTDLIKFNSRPKFASLEEACNTLHCSRQSLFNYMNKGILKRHKIGRKVLLAWDEIDAVLNQGPIKHRR